jgi:hypothetical protein
MQNSERQDIYTRITGQIVASLEKGVRPWMKPWSGQNAAGRITRPLRHNGTPNSVPLSFAQTSNSPLRSVRTTLPTSRSGYKS